jgi:hypothetical protein
MEGSHADHLCHRHHDRIDHRYAGADQTGLIAVFESQQLADGCHLQSVEGAAEKQSQQHDAESQHHDEPHAGDPVLISQSGGADGGGPADDDRDQTAAVDDQPQIAAGQNIFLLGVHLAGADHANPDQDEKIEQEHPCIP